MSVGLVTVAYGTTYQRFLPDWANAVAALETRPDQITIVGDDIDFDILYAISTILGDFDYITSHTQPKNHPQILINEAIEATETDWICKMDVDDLIFPHALTGLNGRDCDVFMFGILVGQKSMFPSPVDAEAILNSPHNMVFSGSPYRRALWEANPYRDMIYEDWAFWIEAAKNGARFTPSGRIDYEYRLHEDNISEKCDKALWKGRVEELR
jgi:hypothetical protein